MEQTAAALANMLDENKEEKVLKEACVGLCQLFGEGIQNDRIQAILEANVVPKLVALLRPSRARAVPISVQSAALQVLGNVACGDDRQTQVVIDSEALPCLRALLASADRGIRKEVCWIVSNITESSHQVQDVLDADILPPLLKLLDNQDAACREDATWVLFNLSSNREPRQIGYLAEKNGVRALCNLLTCSKDLDVLWKGCGTVAAVALKGLRNILICGQTEAESDPSGYNKMAALIAEAHGVERIEALTSHPSDDVRLRSRLLLERMFGAEPTTAGMTRSSSGATMPVTPTLPAPPPPPVTDHAGCSCSYQHHPHHSRQYPSTANFDMSGGPGGSSSSTVDQNGHSHHSLGDATGSTSASSTDSDPEDEDSDSDLIPPPPAPCGCSLCSESAPLSERRPRGRTVGEESSGDNTRKSHHEAKYPCDFCSGGGRLGDGRAGLAAKLGRAVRLGHTHCLALLLSRMTWSQRGAATDAPALLHPGGGTNAGNVPVGPSIPAVVLAANLGKPECLALLLRRCKPDLNQTYGKHRHTPLALAASKGFVRCVKLLIRHGADPSARCAEGITALHLAASGGGNVEICKMLLDRNAPVRALTEKKQTPLCLAARKGHGKVVQLLLARGANPNNEDVEKYTPLHITAMEGIVECLDLLLKAGATVDSKTLKGITPLHFAVEKGHPGCVRLLIGAGAKVNCTKKPLLLIAADEGNRESVQILLDALANIDCKSSMKAFLDKDNEISDYMTPLHVASSKGNQEVVELLLRRGASVDASTDNSRWTALDFAVLNGHETCAVVLLKHGATVSDTCKSIGRNNWTLVQYAANHGAKEVVRLLIQRLKEQRMKTIHGGKFSMSTPDIISPPTTLQTTTQDVQSSVGILPPLSSASDGMSFPSLASTSSSRAVGASSDSVSAAQAAQHHPVITHPMENYAQPVSDDYMGSSSPLPQFDTDTLPLPKLRYSNQDHSFTNGNSSFQPPPAPPPPPPPARTETTTTTKRRAPKEDRESQRRTRELRKREAEAAEARDRLNEAISQRSITKLSEAIAHVSKLVLHLATSGGTDPPATGAAPEYNDADGYTYTDAPASALANGTVNGRQAPPPPPPATHAPPPSNQPLAVEVGLGNEVAKARKMLAELQSEERRARDERAREAADSKRENAQQTVSKAITSTLQGGDPRVLARAVNRALRTVLDRDDRVILEADQVTTAISALEKAEVELRKSNRDRDLKSLRENVPVVEVALKNVSNLSGSGAAERIFGLSDPASMIKDSKTLCDELERELRSAEEEKVQAKNREQAAQEQLKSAVEKGSMKELESALEVASDALLSKDSELSKTIDTSKRTFAKFLKGERRKLRQANGTNDPDSIDAGIAAAEAKGLKALLPDIETSRALATKLREQEAAKETLADAIAEADIPVLGEIKKKLASLGMFPEAERARSELDNLQRAERARTLLGNAIADARGNLELHRKRKRSGTNSNVGSSDDTNGEWVWPDTQRLYELSERYRKYGSSMQKLCDSANDVLKNLAVAGREVLTASVSSDDATVIAACIKGFENSFMNSPCSKLFAKESASRTLADARRKLAAVQAIDQAKVREESNKVKVEYTRATMRRTNVRNKGSRHRTTGNTQANSSNNQNAQPTPPKVTPTAPNGGPKHEAPESNGSSEYGGDDEGSSDVDGAGQTTMAEHLRNVESARHNGARRPRVSNIRPTPIDEMAGLEDMGGGNADCSHYYLFKEGNTVICARCGNLRLSNNAEWLARVKKRGTFVPPEVTTPVSPAGDLGGRSALPMGGLGAFGTGGRGRAAPRQPIAPPTMAAPPVASMAMPGMPLAPPPFLGGIATVSQMAGTRMPLSGPGPGPVKRPAPQTGSQGQTHGGSTHGMHGSPHGNAHGNAHNAHGNNHRGRGGHREEVPPMSGGLFGRAPMQVGGVLPLNLPTMGTGYGRPAGIPQGHSAKGLGTFGSGGLPTGGLYGRMTTTSPLRPAGDLLGRRPGSAGVVGDGAGGGTQAQEEYTAGDLGEEFANQNFGFDIDAIVDDDVAGPPPVPDRGIGGRRVF